MAFANSGYLQHTARLPRCLRRHNKWSRTPSWGSSNISDSTQRLFPLPASSSPSPSDSARSPERSSAHLCVGSCSAGSSQRSAFVLNRPPLPAGGWRGCTTTNKALTGDSREQLERAASPCKSSQGHLACSRFRELLYPCYLLNGSQEMRCLSYHRKGKWKEHPQRGNCLVD